jgi:hypothetical protein
MAFSVFIDGRLWTHVLYRPMAEAIAARLAAETWTYGKIITMRDEQWQSAST